MGHGELLEQGVEGGRACTPVLGLAVGRVSLLDSLLLLVDSLLDRLRPFILHRHEVEEITIAVLNSSMVARSLRISSSSLLAGTGGTLMVTLP